MMMMMILEQNPIFLEGSDKFKEGSTLACLSTGSLYSNKIKNLNTNSYRLYQLECPSVHCSLSYRGEEPQKRCCAGKRSSSSNTVVMNGMSFVILMASCHRYRREFKWRLEYLQEPFL